MFAHCLEQPTRTASLTSPCGVIALSGERPAMPSLFGLAPGGVYLAGSVAGPAVRSYRTFSPLPRRSPQGEPEGRRRAVRSLWHCPWGRPRRVLSGTACRWSPDFPPRRPFDLAGAAVRPTDVPLNGTSRAARQAGVRSQNILCEDQLISTSSGRLDSSACKVSKVE